MTDHDLFPEVKPYSGIEDENQRFTIRRAVAWCRWKAGVTSYDLDVAACAEAHHAPNFYTAEQNGLERPWYGDVFCNPPWSDIRPWVLKAWKAWSEPVHDNFSLISISMLLPGNRTHRPWWQELVEPYREMKHPHSASLTTHCPPERFPYGHPGNPEGIGCTEPNFTSVLLVWRLQ